MAKVPLKLSKVLRQRKILFENETKIAELLYNTGELIQRSRREKYVSTDKF